MPNTNIPPEILDHGLRAADTALLYAIFKHVSQNQPEIARSIVAEAIKNVPSDSGFPGEDSAAIVAKHALKNKLDVLLREIQPPSQLEPGSFQREVRR